ncbi:MAG: hypothetical protein JNJ78_20940 [Anaerolineae bacterium]|nr:hypothetical protein [Anaerolineae bacterium]
MIAAIGQSRRFFVEWILFNLVGFVGGSLLGATDGSVLAGVLGDGTIARVIGDLVFGGCIGAMQYLALRRHFPESHARLILWIPVSMVAFTIGARAGGRFAPMVTTDPIPLGIVFGVLLGGSFGVLHWLGMTVVGTLKAAQPILWIPACIVAWILAEIVAFGLGINQLWMPLIALIIAVVTGSALILWVKPR